MSYQFILSDRFKRDLHTLKRSNKNLSSDLEEFLEKFDPLKGSLIPDTNGARKIRMKITGRGKSGGYRVIYYYVVGTKVFLITVYAKNVKTGLTGDDRREIRKYIHQLSLQ